MYIWKHANRISKVYGYIIMKFEHLHEALDCIISERKGS